jgi:hypothetical protein
VSDLPYLELCCISCRFCHNVWYGLRVLDFVAHLIFVMSTSSFCWRSKNSALIFHLMVLKNETFKHLNLSRLLPGSVKGTVKKKLSDQNRSRFVTHERILSLTSSSCIASLIIVSRCTTHDCIGVKELFTALQHSFPCVGKTTCT